MSPSLSRESLTQVDGGTNVRVTLLGVAALALELCVAAERAVDAAASIFATGAVSTHQLFPLLRTHFFLH